MDRTDALIDLVYEFTKVTGGRLDASARTALREVYTLTVDSFAKKGEKQKVFVWDSKRFRTFIVSQTKKIARASMKKAGDKRITGAVVHQAAVDVMTKTQEYCDTALKDGKLRVAHPQVRKQGEVCTGYLASQM